MATFTQMKDGMKTCPYNPLHKVSTRRLQAHIIKCSRNPANPVLVDCPFNALHRVLPEELQQHILMCKDSRQVIREIEESRNRTPINRPIVQRTEVPDSTDDWDEQIDSDPKTYVIPGLKREENGEEGEQSAEFTIKTQIQVQCMAPLERRKYYKELAERARSKQLPQLKSELRVKEENERPSTSSASKYDIVLDEDNPNNVRNPTTIPFKNKFVGIGRGSTPRSGPRSVGSPSSMDSSIKREWDDMGRGSKRFSPDYQ